MKILVVVDMQKDFVTGALGTAEAAAIVPAVVRKIEAHEGPVAVTYDTHGEDYLESREGRDLPVVHCVKGSEGWQLVPEVEEAIAKKAEHLTFFKPTFGSKELGTALAEMNEREAVDEVELIGVCTDICVISNAMVIRAFLPEVPITVDASCCAGVSPESHAAALGAMKVCQIKVLGE